VDVRIAEVMQAAMVPYKLNLSPGERVLIVADTGTDPLVTTAFMAGARAAGVVPVLALTMPLPYHHADLDPAVVAAMDEVDLVHVITSRAAVHSKVCYQKQLEGKRFIASEEITFEMLRAPAATADYAAMTRVGSQIQAMLNGGQSITITTPAGTDLRGSIAGRSSWLCAVTVLKTPGVDLLISAFPDGEVGVAPVEDSIEGIVVWDVSMHHIGLITDPIRGTVNGGRVVEVAGGREAEALRQYLESNGDEGSWMIAETAIGLNDKAQITGLVREDKKLLGTVHVAIGMNTDVGGRIASKTHLDGIMLHPTVAIDGRTVVDAGRLVVGADSVQ
jgi:2,5-dihydroxypyridine 5,6-dioxygenase